MTLHATRDGQKITVHTTYGPVTNAITETAHDIRHFHGELGRLLDAADEERKAAEREAGTDPYPTEKGVRSPAEHGTPHGGHGHHGGYGTGAAHPI